MFYTTKTSNSLPASRQRGVLGRFCFCSTQSYNRYSYVLNNPLKYTDPSGWINKSVGVEVANADDTQKVSGGGDRGTIFGQFGFFTTDPGLISQIAGILNNYGGEIRWTPDASILNGQGTVTSNGYTHELNAGYTYIPGNVSVKPFYGNTGAYNNSNTHGNSSAGDMNYYRGGGVDMKNATACENCGVPNTPTRSNAGNGGGGANGSYNNSSSIKSTSNLNKILDVFNSLGIGTDTKIAVLNMAKGDLTAINGYLKSMKVLSSVFGYSAIGISAYQYIQTPTTSNLLAFITTTSTVVVAGPVGSVAVGLLDVTKVSGGVYNLLGNIIDSYAGYSVGQSVYNNSASFFNQLIISKK